jgi:hypothetical protein
MDSQALQTVAAVAAVVLVVAQNRLVLVVLVSSL